MSNINLRRVNVVTLLLCLKRETGGTILHANEAGFTA
jgi:hypothetical protein